MMFFLVAYSSKKAGISVTTVASKMSVIFPIAFSIAIDSGDRLTLLKGSAILTAMTGVALTVIRPGQLKREPMAVLVPLLLFVGMGLADLLVKYAQYRFVRDQDTALFSAFLFLTALATGGLILLFSPTGRKAFASFRVWTWGFALGTVNFGSVYFLVRTLNLGNPPGSTFNSSTVFGINNTAIVALSVLAGYLIFTERPKPVNWAGIIISMAALLLFSKAG
jgi:drug/metabolite transporter (DMT)-like permease